MTSRGTKGTIVITGGTGLVGRRLTTILTESGYGISILSRSKKQDSPGVKHFLWDPEKGTLDARAFEGAISIIHLAGENVGASRWSSKRKREIIASRVESSMLLVSHIIDNKIELSSFISASAIGYYGSHNQNRILTEEDGPGDDFLGQTCYDWESASEQLGTKGIRRAFLRTGVVLHSDNPAVKKITMTASLGIYPLPGGGDQYFSWIHIDDLCRMYLHLIEDSGSEGAFNAVAPQQITLLEFVKALKIARGRRALIINLPAFILKMIMGEMSVIVLEGNKISSAAIVKRGYRFQYPSIDGAVASMQN